ERDADRGRPPGRPGTRHLARVPQLRDVPCGAGPGREDRRRTGPARLAGAADLPVALVPDRVAVQVQRQVPPALGTPLRGVPGLRRPAPHRHRRPPGGRFRQPGAAPAALPAPPPARPAALRPPDTGAHPGRAGHRRPCRLTGRRTPRPGAHRCRTARPEAPRAEAAPAARPPPGPRPPRTLPAPGPGPTLNI